jgi:formylglycine-generating enzyme required for sulfatase activity
MFRLPDSVRPRQGSAKAAAVVLITLAVVAAVGGVAWFAFDRPAGELLGDAPQEKKKTSVPPEKKAAADKKAESTPAARRPRVITNSIEMKLALLPAGKFTMGSPATEADRNGNEGPQVEVEIAKDFYIGVHEVTQRDYARIMGNNPSGISFEGGPQERLKGVPHTGDFPVDSVTWDDAVEFCEKLSELIGERNAGRVYRLPTEAEWEYACRAGTTTAFAFGPAAGGKDLNCNGELPYGDAPAGPYLKRTAKVGSYRPNAFGLYDMHGNVFEWCQDWFGPYGAGPLKSPAGPENGDQRVLRGGAWNSAAAQCRSASRNRGLAALSREYIGFRVVMTK